MQLVKVLYSGSFWVLTNDPHLLETSYTWFSLFKIHTECSGAQVLSITMLSSWVLFTPSIQETNSEHPSKHKHDYWRSLRMPQRQMVWFDSFQLLQILFYRRYYFNLNTHYLLFKSLGLVNKKKIQIKIATYKWSIKLIKMVSKYI